MTHIAFGEAVSRQTSADETALRAFRSEFPELCQGGAGDPPLVHLKACSCGPTPLRVEAALARFQAEKRLHGPEWERWYLEYVYTARERFAQLYQAEPAQVAMRGNVSDGLGMLASCLHGAARAQFEGRYQVVVFRQDFPTIGDVFANYSPLGLEVVLIDQDTDDLTPYLTSKTLLVAVSHVSYLTGQRRDLAALVQQTHDAGALLLIDDSQSAGTFPLAFNALGIDMLITGSSKYLLAGEGASAWLIVAKPLLEKLEPPGAGWAAHRIFPLLCAPTAERAFADEEALWDAAQFAYAPDASRFSTGTAPIKAAVEASEAFKFLLETGLERIQQQIARQVDLLLGICYELQLPLMGTLPRPQGPMVALRAASPAHAGELVAILHQHRIWASDRGSAVRLAIHAYVTDPAIDRVRLVLTEHRRWLDVQRAGERRTP